MSVSGVKGNSVFGCFSKVGKKEVAQTESPQKKVNVKKALAVASAAATAIGLGLIAVNQVRKGKLNSKILANRLPNLNVQEQIADVASRTKKGCVGARMEDLAEAFGAAVKHVPQKASIVG